MEGNCLRKVSCPGNKGGQLDSPEDVTYLNDDNILVADQLNHRIQQFNVQTGNFVKSFGKEGTRDGEFQNPVSVCVDDEGRVIVAECFNHRVQVLSQDGEPLFKFGDSGPEKLKCPSGCIYHQNKFIVSDWDDKSVQFYDNTGKIFFKIREPRQGDEQLYLCPTGLSLQKCGDHHNLLVCDRNNGRVDQFTLEGCFTGKTDYKFKGLTRITTTPDGLILVSDCLANKIYILN